MVSRFVVQLCSFVESTLSVCMVGFVCLVPEGFWPIICKYDACVHKSRSRMARFTPEHSGYVQTALQDQKHWEFVVYYT